MEAVAKGAKKANGITIGILPGSNMEESPPNHFIDIPIFTGMSDGRNAINAKTADIIIAIGGEGGTLSEIGLALKNNKEVVALQSWELKRKDKIPSQYHTVGSPEEAVELAFSLVARYKL
jgi:uncharacterized protein (TIGR00725 family)